MADSKTARASMVREVKEKHVETQSEAIKALRDNLVAGLFVGSNDRIKHLLAAYDDLLEKYEALESAINTEAQENAIIG